MHADVLESEDAESGLDPFRLKIELPQVGENPTGFVSAFDAVSFVVPRDRGPRAVVASACDTEEPLRHGPANRGFLDGLSGLGGKGYARPLPWRRVCRSEQGAPCFNSEANSCS